MRFVRLARMNILLRLAILFFCCIAPASAQEQFANLSIKGLTIRAEIADALAVAVALNAGAAMVYSGRVMDAVAAMEGKA